MVKLEELLKDGKVGRINELELERYLNFYRKSYEENLEHMRAVVKRFPRWAIISGYFAMHDIAKLLIAKKLWLKINREVHKTTIEILEYLVGKKKLARMLEEGYERFSELADMLSDAKRERVRAQYYTGSEFLERYWKERAEKFNTEVELFVKLVNELLGDGK